METDYSKHTHFRWKIKWRLEHLGALGIMGETAPLTLGVGIEKKDGLEAIRVEKNSKTNSVANALPKKGGILKLFC